MRSSLLLIYLCTLAFKSCSGRGWAIPSKSRKKAGIFIQWQWGSQGGERGAKVRLVCKGVLRMHHMPILPLSVVLNPELSLQIFRFGWINLYQPTPSYPFRIFFFFFFLPDKVPSNWEWYSNMLPWYPAPFMLSGGISWHGEIYAKKCMLHLLKSCSRPGYNGTLRDCPTPGQWAPLTPRISSR